MLLAACSSGPREPEVIGPPFQAAIASDEARASLIGREVLRVGGTAADAAAAIGFALSVTRPTAASLGGGGVCIVWEPRSQTAETLDFIAVVPAMGGGGGREVAVPGAPRGLAALHAKHGRLRWSQIVAPSEALARVGFPISRGLAEEIAVSAAELARDPGAKRVFFKRDGHPLAEGDTIIQADLADTLATLRNDGAISTVTGPLAERIVAGARAGGAGLTLEDLAAFPPSFRETVVAQVDGFTLHTAPAPAMAGLTAVETVALAAGDGRHRRTAGQDRPHLFAEATMRAHWDRGNWQGEGLTLAMAPSDILNARRIAEVMATYRPEQRVAAGQLQPPPSERNEDPVATGFVAIDSSGLAVSCAMTSNGAFGLARMVPGTGILLAAAPNDFGRGPQSLATMIALQDARGPVLFAGAATGGRAAAPALAQVALGTVFDRRSLLEAMDTPRFYHPGAPDFAIVEVDAGNAAGVLQVRGYEVTVGPGLSRVNAVYCRQGLPRTGAGCQSRADPRGSGIGLVVP